MFYHQRHIYGLCPSALHGPFSIIAFIWVLLRELMMKLISLNKFTNESSVLDWWSLLAAINCSLFVQILYTLKRKGLFHILDWLIFILSYHCSG